MSMSTRCLQRSSSFQGSYAPGFLLLISPALAAVNEHGTIVIKPKIVLLLLKAFSENGTIDGRKYQRSVRRE